jgi:hypothetical protein
MPNKIEIDPRKTDFLGHFHPEDRQTVIEWTFRRFKTTAKTPTAEQLFEALRKELHKHSVKDVYPFLRERLLFMFEARPQVIRGWAEWCLEWHALPAEEKQAAKSRFKRGRDLWVRR